MIKWRLSDEPIADDETEEFKEPATRSATRCTIFLGYTSNMASCGMREYIRYLCQHSMVSCIVTTCGGIEEDFMKLFADHYMGDFELEGEKLRKQGLNRIGNLIVPNHNYSLLEAWFVKLVQEMHAEQKASNNTKFFTPSEITWRMGKKLDDENHPNKEESIYYWCYKNNIAVFCPAFTDGALGDIMYFDSYRDSGFICDINADLRKINDIAMKAKKSGQIIIGGGVVKHHINNANLMRNGANFSVLMNTA
jgi:deoxyhypusine synthase